MNIAAQAKKLGLKGPARAEYEQRMRQEMAMRSPVGRVNQKLLIDQCREQTANCLTRIGIRAYMTQDGEHDVDLLALLAVLIGIGAEIAHKVTGDSVPTRRMHAALRAIVQMSVDGGAWVAAQTKVLHDAAQLASSSFDTHPDLGLTYFTGAQELGDKIRAGTARMSDVAGAEIYNVTQ